MISGRIHVHVTIYRRLLIGEDDNLDLSEAYNIHGSYTSSEKKFQDSLSVGSTLI